MKAGTEKVCDISDWDDINTGTSTSSREIVRSLTIN
jgi:hypothetical protein